LALDPDVSRYIVSRIDRSFTMARQVIEELNKVTLAAKRKLTIHIAREVLSREEFSRQSTLNFGENFNGNLNKNFDDNLNGE
jgi:chromosomal replication initiation ATPase DnaA